MLTDNVGGSSMSGVIVEQLDIREQISRIDRNMAETQKLLSESRKFNRDHLFLVLSAFLAVLAAIVARLPEILHAFKIG